MLVDAHLALSEGIQASMIGETDAARRFLTDAQAKYTALTRRDSMDAEVWYGLGDAYFHEPANNESYVRLMGNAMNAFQRTLELDSTLHLAYPHLLTIYTVSGNPNAPIILRGDSLVMLTTARKEQLGQPAIDSARGLARQRALATARHWVIHDPNAREAYTALANAYAVANDYGSAAAALRTAVARRDVTAPEFPFEIATYEMYAGKPHDALATLRSGMSSENIDALREYGTAQRFAHVFSAAEVAAYLGKPSFVDSLSALAIALDPQLPGAFMGRTSTPMSVFLDPWVALTKAALGMDFSTLRAPLDAVARNFDPNRPGVGQQARQINSLLMYSAFIISRDSLYYDALRRWSGDPDAPPPPDMEALLAIGRGDTAAARTAAQRIDRATNPGNALFGVFLRAEVLAEVGDLRGAIAAYESIDPSTMTQLQAVPDPRWPLYARSNLARGQMYEELGERAKAEAAYQQFIDLWKDADPVLQPQISAARAGIARLRDRPAT
jgi:tetratricopeptide (TPR) repeat protein